MRKGGETKDQITNIRWTIEKARKFQEKKKKKKTCFIDFPKGFDLVDHTKMWKILKEMEIPYLPPEKTECESGSKS